MAMPFKSMLAFLHRTVFKLRFGWRSRSWSSPTDLTPPIDKTIVISGFLNEALGIGRAAQLLSSALQEKGFRVFHEDLRPLDRGLLTRRAAPFPTGGDAAFWLIVANPPEARIALFTRTHADWRDMYRIGVWHWESSIAPAQWIKTAAWFNEIWVSSQFTADAITAAMHRANASQHIKKIRVCPLPVSAPACTPASTHADYVEVLTMFDPRSDFERKNPMGAIEAWLKAFPQVQKKARLTIKSHSTALEHPRYRDLVMRVGNRNDIRFIAETLNQANVDTLIAGSDILLSLHRGEGFGLPLAEAMGMGIAVMATGWSGNMQFMTPENSVLIPYKLVRAPKNYNGPSAHWAEPDTDAAASELKRLVANPDLRQRLGKTAREDIIAMRENW